MTSSMDFNFRIIAGPTGHWNSRITGTDPPQRLPPLPRYALRHRRHCDHRGGTRGSRGSGPPHPPRPASIPSGNRPVPLPAPARPNGPRVGAVSAPTEQANFSLGIRTCSRPTPALCLADAQRHARENMSSRLFQVIREQHGLTQHSLQPQFLDDCGDLVSSPRDSDPGDLEKTLRLVRRELERIQSPPPVRPNSAGPGDYVLGQQELPSRKAPSIT